MSKLIECSNIKQNLVLKFKNRKSIHAAKCNILEITSYMQHKDVEGSFSLNIDNPRLLFKYHK